MNLTRQECLIHLLVSMANDINNNNDIGDLKMGCLSFSFWLHYGIQATVCFRH